MNGLPDLEGLAVNDEQLRSTARDARPVVAALRRAEALLDAARAGGDRRAEMRLLGYVGNARRMLGDFEGAVAANEQAQELAEALGDARASVVAAIRLGEAHRCADGLARAEDVLRAALARSPRDLRDFALQHLGKCLCDAGDTARAVPLLEEALELRRRKDDPELIRSTESALARARAGATP